MRRRDLVRRAGRSLGQAKIRTLLTSLAIAVGAFTLTISLAAGQGSRDYANKIISSNIDPQSLFVVKDEKVFGATNGSDASAISEYDPDAATSDRVGTYKQLLASDITKIRQNPDVASVTPIYSLSPLYTQFQGNAKKYTVNVSTYGSGVLTDVAAGKLPATGAPIGDNDVILPQAVTDTLGGSIQSYVGKTVTITFARQAQSVSADQIAAAYAQGGVAAVQKLTAAEQRDFTFTVRAVTKKPATAVSAPSQLLISPARASEIADFSTQGTSSYQKYFAATAIVKKGVDPASVKEALARDGYPSKTAKDLQSFLFTVVNVLQAIVLGFGVIALIASVFGIINTQYISVLERTSQIGLMKALGMRGKDVAKLFRYEAAWIGFLGGVIGAAAAVTAGTLLNPWIMKSLQLGEGNYLLEFRPLPIAVLLVALIIIAILAGYFPARKAARLDPIEALRTE